MATLNRTHLIDVDHETGAYIQGWARIRQSIVTILTTRLKTRLMRLWWGSSFQDMQDKPGNQQTFMDGIVAAIQAVNRYEPEFKITSVEITNRSPDGSVRIKINGVDLVDRQARALTEIV